jgi:uncharacterized protein
MGWRGIIVGLIFAMLAMAPIAMANTVLAEGPAPIEQISIVTNNTASLVTAEIADTEELRNRGLMFRHILPEGHAMLFDFGKPRPAAMWMKNTYMSLDMLFIRADGTVAAIAENTEPLSEQTISVQEPVRGVLELPAGTAKKLGIHRDDKIYHRIFKTAEQQ